MYMYMYIFHLKKQLNLEQIEIRALKYIRRMNGAVVHLMNHSELLGPLRLLFPENISMRKAREVAIETSITTCHMWGLCRYGNGLFCI